LLKKIKIPIEFYRKLPQIFRSLKNIPKGVPVQNFKFHVYHGNDGHFENVNPKYTSKGSFLWSFLKEFFRNTFKKKEKKRKTEINYLYQKKKYMATPYLAPLEKFFCLFVVDFWFLIKKKT
jgi:hypothetical protein